MKALWLTPIAIASFLPFVLFPSAHPIVQSTLAITGILITYCGVEAILEKLEQRSKRQ